jgi:hypothetical protein
MSERHHAHHGPALRPDSATWTCCTPPRLTHSTRQLVSPARQKWASGRSLRMTTSPRQPGPAGRWSICRKQSAHGDGPFEVLAGTRDRATWLVGSGSGRCRRAVHRHHCHRVGAFAFCCDQAQNDLERAGSALASAVRALATYVDPLRHSSPGTVRILPGSRVGAIGGTRPAHLSPRAGAERGVHPTDEEQGRVQTRSDQTARPARCREIQSA